MKRYTLLFLSLVAAGCGSGSSAPNSTGTRQFDITLQNLTSTESNSGQPFSPPVFTTHDGATQLWQLGGVASLGIQNIAETGNRTEAINTLRPLVGASVLSLETPLSSPLQPGRSVTVRVSVDATHPYFSHAWMLERTNDGFGGQDSINLFEQAGTQSYELYGLDAGTEVNNERRGFIGALGAGDSRDPEGGRIRLHEGITGRGDAPLSWNWNSSTISASQIPVARVTITPVP
ncbi:spondin domain-containing protein [Armatimonas sp.]|uniref:spondin domain-containing protein n=1 Tax=Armatimonas sp. TaxID=1872638 RepID=UPI00286D430A|nr:spondin domain-containing protein [Armatimonas sp.]